MKQPLRPGLCCATGLLTAMLGLPALLHAQVSTPPPAQAPRSDRVGLDLFGGASVSFPAAQDSFEAVGLKTTAFEFGGGVRVTGLWRRLFLQVAANHWSDGGERTFVASDGTVFPLGILLDVKATFVDATVVSTIAGRRGGRETSDTRCRAPRTRLVPPSSIVALDDTVGFDHGKFVGASASTTLATTNRA